MKGLTRAMAKEYRTRGNDWMGYTIQSINQLSYHHIQKKEDGGPFTWDNGALLRRDTAHEYLHIIEYKDLEMYDYINGILKQINTQGYQPTREELIAIRNVLLSFEREHCSDRNSKGKILIKSKYIEGRRQL